LAVILSVLEAEAAGGMRTGMMEIELVSGKTLIK
jgi:hypothetical protein